MEPVSDVSSQGWFQYYWYENVDPRTKDWTIIRSPWIIPSLILSYLYFVLFCGPQFMKTRPSYSLTTFIKCYNLFQIIVNATLVYSILNAGWLTELSIFCSPFMYSFEPNSYKLAQLECWALMVRLIDLTETVVFVLRKKNNQVSFLHLYHHVSTVVMGWFITKYMAAESLSFPVIINCSVHVIMYTYYFLTTFEGQIKMYMMKVKSTMTTVQMVQFFILMLYGVQGWWSECSIPKSVVNLLYLYLIANIILFYNFYTKNYIKSPKKM